MAVRTAAQATTDDGSDELITRLGSPILSLEPETKKPSLDCTMCRFEHCHVLISLQGSNRTRGARPCLYSTLARPAASKALMARYLWCLPILRQVAISSVKAVNSTEGLSILERVKDRIFNPIDSAFESQHVQLTHQASGIGPNA